MDELCDTTLGSIADGPQGFVDGPFGSNLPASDYTPIGVPVIRGSNLAVGPQRFVADEFVFVSANTANRLARSKALPRDIIFTKKGTIGQTGFVPLIPHCPEFIISSNQMRLRVDQSRADPLFVYYYVSSNESIEKVIRDSEATGVPKTNLTYFRDFPIRLPCLAKQRAIASVLSALDDKIELNRRLNETLEAMARAIFKDWFVDFGPTRAKMAGRAPYLASDIWSLFPGRLDADGYPEGWKAGTLGEIAEQAGASVSPEALSPETPYFGLEHLPRRSLALDAWEGAGKVTSGKLSFKRGDFLFGKLRPYFHKVGIAPVDGICSTDIVVLQATNLSAKSFVISCISQDEFVAYTDRTSDGTKMPRTSWARMKNYEICIPSDPVLFAFNEATTPMFDRIVANVHESRMLAETRDLLLPKLMSGEVRVEDVAKAIGDRH